jgi:uncharacterized protein (TIGR02246 family)
MLAAVAVAMLASCTALQKPAIKTGKTDLAVVQRAIDSANTLWVKAMRKKDASAVAQLFASSGAMLTASGKVYQGHDAIEGLMTKNFKVLGPVVAVIRTQNVWQEGNTAYETGQWQYTFIPPGSKSMNKKHLSGQYLVIWQRQLGGTWKIIKDFGLND